MRRPSLGLLDCAVADVVGQDDEIALGIEQLALAEQPAGIAVAQKPSPGAAGAVQDQHAVAHDAVGILPRLPTVR